nr:phage tail protein [Limosilactobacillus equigenerosi]
MINISIHNADDKQAVLQAYSVALTEELNSYPTVNFMYDITGHNATVEDMLDQGTIFEINGQLYRHLNSNPVPVGNFRTYTVDAIHIGSMLQDNYVNPSLKGKHSIEDVANAMIAGLDGFKFKIDDKFDPIDFGDDGIESGHGEDILNTIVEMWNCEYRFDNKTIHIAKAVGKKEDSPGFLFIDGNNVSKISWTEDYSNFKTAIHGYGKQIEIEVGGDDGDGTGGNLDNVEGFAKSPINADFAVDVNRMKSDFANRSWKVKARGVDVNRLYDVVKKNGVSPEWFFAYELMEQGTTYGWLNHTYAHGDPYQDAEYVCGWIKQIANSNTLNPAWTAAEGAISANSGLTAKWNSEFGKGTIGRVYLQGTAAAVWELAGTSGNSSMGKPMAGCVSVIKSWGGHTNSGHVSSGWGWPFPNNKSYTLGIGYKFGYDGGFRDHSYHDGTDWSKGLYSGDVHAIHPGVVTLVDGYNFGTGSGRIVVKGNDGYTVVYQEWTWSGSSGAHVSVGQRINIGDVICTLQASHVHIGVTTKDFNTAFSNSFSSAGGWVDPIPLIQKGGSAKGQSAPAKKSRAQEVIAYAEKYVGQPYVWGGPRGVDKIVPTDCSGMTSNIYKHFGITIGGVTYTQATCGRRISRSEVQTGDLGFYDPGCHHVVMALDNKRAIQEPQPGQNCNIFNIDSYAPSYWIRNDQMAALVAGGGNASDAGESSAKEKKMVYSCEADYISPLAKKKNIGYRWASPVSSETITDENQLKEWLKTQLQDYPDVEYSVDWISFTKKTLAVITMTYQLGITDGCVIDMVLT